MTLFLAQQSGAGTNSHNMTLPSPSVSNQSLSADSRVGAVPLSPFERRLKALLYLQQQALRRWERFGCFSDRGQADRFQLEMDAMRGQL